MSYPAGAPQEQQQQEGVPVGALSNSNLNHQIHSNDPSGSSDNSSSSRSTTVSPGSAETTASSVTGNTGDNSNWKPGSPSSQQKQHNHPYRNILTHQERKKLRMPKRKADSWPASILADSDVLSLDDEGRFVLCKVCHVHYAVHGGKKPKPVIMNSSFRTRAWDVHKERTNSHRMQKKQDDHRRQPHAMTADENEQKSPARETKSHSTENSSASAQQQQKPQVQQQQQAAQAQLQQALADEQQQVRFAPPAPKGPLGHSPLGHSPLGRPEFISPPPPSPRRRVFRPSAQLGPHHWQPSDHDVHRRNSHASAHDHHRLNADSPATSVVSVAAAAGAIGSNSALPTVSVTASASTHGRKVTTNASMASEQRDGMMRWQNMHDHVSRALTMPKRPAQDQFPSAELRDSNAVLGETEDFGVNNEKVAKKLKSLDDEYDAKILKRPDVHYDRRSANYKQYWGTLRDVYTAPTTTALNNASNNNHNSNHNSSSNHTSNSRSGGPHKTLPSLRQQQQQQREIGGSSSNRKDMLQDVGDSTTPDDTGSSEDSAKTIVVHDQALVNAIDRLTGIVSKQLSSSERHAQESSVTVDALASLATAVTEMRVHQDNAFGRLIELQEQRLQVMEAILQHKLRKEARSSSNSGSSSVSNSNNSGVAS